MKMQLNENDREFLKKEGFKEEEVAKNEKYALSLEDLCESIAVDRVQGWPDNLDMNEVDRISDPLEAYLSLQPAYHGVLYEHSREHPMDEPAWLNITTKTGKSYKFLMTDDFLKGLKSAIDYYEEDSQNSQTV